MLVGIEMPQYRVHLFPVMRIVYDITANTPIDALSHATMLLTDETWRRAIEVEYENDPITEAIVDSVEPDCGEVLRTRFLQLTPVKPL
jgi:hypothetical protein